MKRKSTAAEVGARYRNPYRTLARNRCGTGKELARIASAVTAARLGLSKCGSWPDLPWRQSCAALAEMHRPISVKCHYWSGGDDGAVKEAVAETARALEARG
ncbi:hypothetical protein KCP78_12625 [Salmonella enterica subsp. enterica]|nr:hypothetical protein KCP78_12625 [Salmonella enterica subsp. enterica]